MRCGSTRFERISVMREGAMRLQDKVCLITGAGSGIGRATAELFAREGATVLATGVDAAAGLKPGADVAGRGWRLDVTDQASCESVVAEAIRQTGRIDVLFNNAGIAGVGRLHETSLELWERVMAVNVRGVFLASRAVLPHMIEQRSGSIVNMSSCIPEMGLAACA